MRILLISFFILSSTLIQAQNRNFWSYKYKVDNTKITSWSILGVAGFAGGANARYGFHNRVFFERKFDADPNGFWGSQSWRMIYVNGDPAQGVKSNFRKRVGAVDFYHVADKTMRFGYIGGSLTLGINSRHNTRWWHTAIDIGIGIAASTIGQNIGMNLMKL